jgi:hypothetical protein
MHVTHLNSRLSEYLSQPAGIGINGIPNEQLITYTYDVALHTLRVICIFFKIEAQNIKT